MTRRWSERQLGIVDLRSFHIGAGQMHACLQTILRLGCFHHLQSQGRMATACAPGNINKCGAEIVHAIHAVVEVLDALDSLRREEFEGEGRLVTLAGESQFL